MVGNTRHLRCGFHGSPVLSQEHRRVHLEVNVVGAVQAIFIHVAVALQEFHVDSNRALIGSYRAIVVTAQDINVGSRPELGTQLL